jgi:hypothetical protein
MRLVPCLLLALASAACQGTIGLPSAADDDGPVGGDDDGSGTGDDDTPAGDDDDDGGEMPPAECAPSERLVVEGQLAAPAFAVDRGLFDEPFDVAIDAEAGSDIIYTFDGSVPDEGNGTRAAAPVTLHIATTTVVRARAFADGRTPSHPATYSYIFPEHVLDQPADPPGYPSIEYDEYASGSQPLDHEMDPDIVGADRDAVRSALRAIPSLSIVLDHDDMFGDDGIYASGGSGQNSAFERATSFEIIDPARPAEQLQIDAALRPHTHVLAKRSFKVQFKGEYGPGKLRTCLFRDAPLNGDGAETEFDSIILRSGTNRGLVHWCNPDDSTYTEDEWMHDSQIAMSGYGSHGTYAHLYINGLYYGLYNVMERPDDSFTSEYFGGDKQDYFAINHGGYVDGDPSRWEYLTQSLIYEDMSDPERYAELQQYVDVDNLIDYLLLNWFAGTTDWPENNWYGGMRMNPPGPVRFFVWDADEVWDGRCAGPGDPTPDHYGAWVKPDFVASAGFSGYAIADIWHAARRSPDFMQRFVERVDQHLLGDGALTEAQSLARWDALTAVVEQAFVAETARWGDWRTTYGERTRTIDNMWRPTVERWRSERLPGNVDRFLDALRAEGYYR